MRTGFDDETGFTGQLVKTAQADGRFDFLRTRQNHGRQVVLFRNIQPSDCGRDGLLRVCSQAIFADGKIRAADIYVYTHAEFFSATLRRTLLPIIANESRTLLDRLLTMSKTTSEIFQSCQVSSH